MLVYEVYAYTNGWMSWAGRALILWRGRGRCLLCFAWLWLLVDPFLSYTFSSSGLSFFSSLQLASEPSFFLLARERPTAFDF